MSFPFFFFSWASHLYFASFFLFFQLAQSSDTSKLFPSPKSKVDRATHFKVKQPVLSMQSNISKLIRTQVNTFSFKRNLKISLRIPQTILTLLIKPFQGFPGGAVVRNPPANAADGHGFKPWSGKIPHAAERLGP